MSDPAREVLRLLAKQLKKHLPSSEAGVREVLAQAAREAFSLRAGAVEVEAPWGRKRLDVRVHQPAIVFELKYHRPIASGRNRPMTAQYGQLLADVRKLATVDDGSDRILVLLTDQAGITHLINKELLPPSTLGRRRITGAAVRSLARSASGPALAEGDWIDVTVSLIAHDRAVGSGISLYAWRVEPT